jgi:hypothetical protein
MGCLRNTSAVAAMLICLGVTSAHALTANYNAGSTATSVAGATTFWDFDGTANTSIGTVTATLMDLASNPVPSNPSNNWGLAFGTQSVTVNLTNPVSYLGFTWGTPDADNTVQVFEGATLLATLTGTSLNITQFHDLPGTGFLDIFAGSGEAITSLVLTGPTNAFEVDNFAATPVSATPLPAALPLFATGLGALGLLGWRRNRRMAI